MEIHIRKLTCQYPVVAHSKGLTLNGKKVWSDTLCDFEMSLLPLHLKQIERLIDKTNANELEIW